jgi:hypothetical protein
MSARTVRDLGTLVLLTLATVRCAPGDAAADPLVDAPAIDQRAPHVEPAARLLIEPGALPLVQAVEVAGRTGPGGQPFEVARRAGAPAGAHARRFGLRTMLIGLRTGTPDLTQYPCSACHLGRGLVPSVERAADAHQDIAAAHPAELDGACTTCHATADVELLELRNGERVSVDHAYRLCAQCHFSQADAWAAGAHGKRLDGWQGRRVVMSCADCHDPHRPALEQRLPFRAPRLERTGRREP